MAIAVSALRKAFSRRTTRETRRNLIVLNVASRNYEQELRDTYSTEIPTITLAGAPADQTRGGSWPTAAEITQINTTFAVDQSKSLNHKIEIETIDDSNLPYVEKIRSDQRYDMQKAIDTDMATVLTGHTFQSNMIVGDSDGVDATNYIDVNGVPHGTGFQLIQDALFEANYLFQENEILAPSGAAGPDTADVNQMPIFLSHPRMMNGLLRRLDDKGTNVSRDLAARYGGVYASINYGGEYQNSRLLSTPAIPKPTSADKGWKGYYLTREAVEAALRDMATYVREPEHVGGNWMELVITARWGRILANETHVLEIVIPSHSS